MFDVMFSYMDSDESFCCTFSKVRYDGARLCFIADNASHSEVYFADKDTASSVMRKLTKDGHAFLTVLPKDAVKESTELSY